MQAPASPSLYYITSCTHTSLKIALHSSNEKEQHKHDMEEKEKMKQVNKKKNFSYYLNPQLNFVKRANRL